MNLFADLEQIVKHNEPMANYTWFRLGGPARYMVFPEDQQQLTEVVRRCHENNVDMYVLGNGSNLLVADQGLNGVVIKLDNENFKKITVNDNIVTAGAGAGLSSLIRYCARAGLSGLECLTGIPGSVGGAVKMNAGGRFGDIGNVAHSVSLMDSSGYCFERSRGDIFFGYRMTNIMARFILTASFSLTPDDPDNIARMIKQVWMLKKNSQPVNTRNAGCVFKNPRALSAGAMIDKAGLKGTSVGGAMVSHTHANFIVVEDNATAKDVMTLIDIVRKRVRERFDVELELELEIWK